MKKTIIGYLFNRIEKMGGRRFNHIGCEGESKEFGDFLASFVPQIGMRRKVKFTIETIEDGSINVSLLSTILLRSITCPEISTHCNPHD